MIKYIVLIFFICSITSLAQDKTTEKRSSKDSTGKVTITESEIISKTEDITPRNYMIIINPLKFFLFYNINFYARVNPNIALGFGVQTPTLSGLSGIGANAEIRIHPRGKSLKGFYVAPNFSINSITSGSSTATFSSIGVLLGWQWFPGEDFAMGLGIGIDNYFGSTDRVAFNSIGLAPALRFDIGFAW
jgi:hypothetical protein